MIDYAKLFQDIYNGVLNMISSMKEFVTWLNTPLVDINLFQQKPVENIGDFFLNIFQIGVDVLYLIPKMLLDLMETLIGVNLGQLSPAYLILGNGIFFLIGLKIIKAIVPIF